MSTNVERREANDRRDRNAIPEFSLIDVNGKLVTSDRRARKDRRTGVDVTQTTLSEKEFAEFFRKANEETSY